MTVQLARNSCMLSPSASEHPVVATHQTVLSHTHQTSTKTPATRGLGALGPHRRPSLHTTTRIAICVTLSSRDPAGEPTGSLRIEVWPISSRCSFVASLLVHECVPITCTLQLSPYPREVRMPLQSHDTVLGHRCRNRPVLDRSGGSIHISLPL